MGSPFASLVQSDPIPLPFDLPHTVTVRKLTGAEVERAQSVHQRSIASGRGWANKFRREIEKGIATDGQVLEAIADPLLGYDRMTMVQAGLVAWSYETKPGKPKPLTTDAKADLDDEALDFIALEVLRLTKPGLFQTEEEREQATKNG